MNILLLCAAGMSSSLLAYKMTRKLTDEQRGWVIEADPVENIAKIIGSYDVVLLGPQMRHKYEKIKRDYPDIPIGVISTEDYGKDDGSKLLQQAIDLFHGRKE